MAEAAMVDEPLDRTLERLVDEGILYAEQGRYLALACARQAEPREGAGAIAG